MDSSIEDIEFLAGSAYRAAGLRKLIHEPCDRDVLLNVTGASRATIARLLNELEERNWVERDGHQYELTDSGRVVAEAFIGLVDTVETERTLRDVGQYLPSDLPGFTISFFDDAVITFPQTHSPYRTVPRFIELVEEARTMRGFSERSPKPSTSETIIRNAAAGMEAELTFPPAVIHEIQTTVSADVIEQAVNGGHLTILECDTFPTNAGVVFFDGRLALYCRDEIGVTRVTIDTDKPDAITWGESIYEEVLADAHPVDLLERVA